MRTAAVFPLIACLSFVPTLPAAERSGPDQQLEIGMAESMFPGVPKTLRNVVADPFTSLLKRYTGLKGHLNYFESPQAVAAALDDGRLHIAVLYGHEFGWVAEKHPELEPLLVATPTHPFQTFCVVRHDHQAKSLADLEGQTVSVPAISRAYSTIFLARQQKEVEARAKLGEQNRTLSSTDAIFNVIEGKSGCAIVDAGGLRLFEATNPGASQQIRTLCQSDEFPSACILVRRGTLDSKLQNQLAETLLRVEKLSGSRMLLDVWRIRGFHRPQQTFLDDCRRFGKDYPCSLTAK